MAKRTRRRTKSTTRNIALPDFSFEKRLWKKGYKVVAGLDEVGRGCFAGPVVAAAVVFDMTFKGFPLQGVKIDDSKKLTARQRERAAKWIKKNALSWGIGEASVVEINRLRIGKATGIAFRKSILDCTKKLKNPPAGRQDLKTAKKLDFLLVDAFFIPYVSGLPVGRRKLRTINYELKTGKNQMAIVNGDEKSFSIAAASILAKVYRDGKLKSKGLIGKYRKYGWDRNKGYGTRQHQEAILRYGITRYHRKVFVETFLRTEKQKNFFSL